MSRREDVILLLQTRTAWHPGIRSQFATFGATSGEHATQRVTCTSCLGERVAPSRAGPVPCNRCQGKGSYRVDAYTGYRSRDEGPWRQGGLTAVEKRRLGDAELQRMAQQTAPPTTAQDLLEQANQHPEPWERQREAHHRHGSYRELTLALEWLADRAPNMARLVVWVYELGIVAPGVETAARALQGVDALAGRMPDPIRVPVWLRPAHPAQARIERRKVAA